MYFPTYRGKTILFLLSLSNALGYVLKITEYCKIQCSVIICVGANVNNLLYWLFLCQMNKADEQGWRFHSVLIVCQDMSTKMG